MTAPTLATAPLELVCTGPDCERAITGEAAERRRDQRQPLCGPCEHTASRRKRLDGSGHRTGGAT
jgi:hypothetical protein